MIADDQGEDELDSDANDPGGSQKDLSGVRLFDDGNIGWTWDEPGFPSGANSLDTCTYWNEGGNLNTTNVIVLCYSTQLETGGGGGGTVVSSVVVYECGDGYDAGLQKCGGNSAVSTRYTATCDDPPEEVDPVFSGDNNKDFKVDCVLTATGNAPPVDELRYLNTCSKASESESSVSDDCAFAEVGK